MTAEELSAWENRGLPAAGRLSDAAETRADERHDENHTLNFPLHWTSWLESWNYLFDFSLACELLAPRPDDLVLDMAAGTGWATEFLQRLGVRTVSLDLSLEMMRRGRKRLALDSRLVFRREAGFVVGRGQSLPFADASFDGLLCLNALHHLPSYASALAEIHRVLKPGGRAVFSEPGTDHPSRPLPKARMAEEGVLEKGVSLPLLRRLAFEAGFSRMRVIPLRAPATYVLEYEAGRADYERLDLMWDETLRLGPSEFARFVLEKGEGRPADTFLPPDKLAGRLRAEIAVGPAPGRTKEGQAVSFDLEVVNAGTVAWRARGRRFGGQVTAGLKICAPSGDVLREDLGRTPLAADVEPGESARLTVFLPGVLPPGAYELRFDMVVEGVTWFEPYGSLSPRLRLEISP
ncbi:MAG: class I SAM-dependent methyltransferase [Candidatus Aminicenantes bacterium]|nr:class I SAM-dependent methyltransferase [Candidatus Aminicenantes bacterium]